MARGVIFEVAVRRRHVRFSSLNGNHWLSDAGPKSANNG